MRMFQYEHLSVPVWKTRKKLTGEENYREEYAVFP
jgi:hypothetical protein